MMMMAVIDTHPWHGAGYEKDVILESNKIHYGQRPRC